MCSVLFSRWLSQWTGVGAVFGVRLVEMRSLGEIVRCFGKHIESSGDWAGRAFEARAGGRGSSHAKQDSTQLQLLAVDGPQESSILQHRS